MEEPIGKKPHAVCIPLPAQGHINPILKLAKLLHFRGFHITFVHTEFNYHHRLVKSSSGSSENPLLKQRHNFRFETVMDGLPADNKRSILDLPALCRVMPTHCKQSFRDLIVKLNGALPEDNPPVSCIVSDGTMSFTLEVAKEFGIPEMLFFTPSACGMLGYLQFGELVERGYFPLKDESYLSNGYLDTAIDWIPEMKGMRLKDLPTFIRSTDPHDTMFNYNLDSVNKALETKTLILNTFDGLEEEALRAIGSKFPSLYTIGPLSMLHQQLCEENLDSIESNLWETDEKCLEWLDKREPGSVVYVNYGSLVIMSHEQLSEFAWGLANSKYPFMWVIRPNLVEGEAAIISLDFMEEIRDRGLLVGWCEQEKVLRHRSIGGFLTHCGWNSVLESICEGVPMICWPFFSEQQTNCFYLCSKWGIGMEIDTDVKREKIEELVWEMMEGKKGKKMKEKSMEWKRMAKEAIKDGGSSYNNFDLLVKHLKQEEQLQNN